MPCTNANKQDRISICIVVRPYTTRLFGRLSSSLNTRDFVAISAGLFDFPLFFSPLPSPPLTVVCWFLTTYLTLNIFVSSKFVSSNSRVGRFLPAHEIESVDRVSAAFECFVCEHVTWEDITGVERLINWGSIFWRVPPPTGHQTSHERSVMFAMRITYVISFSVLYFF